MIRWWWPLFLPTSWAWWSYPRGRPIRQVFSSSLIVPHKLFGTPKRQFRPTLTVSKRDASTSNGLPDGLKSSRRPSLRNATLSDVALLERWGQTDQVLNSGGNVDYNDWNWPDELARQPAWRVQLIAHAENGVPIGFVQVMDPKGDDSHYWGDTVEPNLRAMDLWIGERNYLNQGYGTQIMKLVLQDYCFTQNDSTEVQAVLVDPMANNTDAIRFYQRLGFQPVGIRYFGPDRCLVHRLNRADYSQSTRHPVGLSSTATAASMTTLQPTIYSIRLRNATLSDMELLETWDAKEHVQKCEHDGPDDDDWNWGVELPRTSLPWRYQLIAETIVGATPVGMIQIIDPALEETHYWGQDCPPHLRALDIWIGDEAYLNLGYGTQMMELALRDYCFADPTVQAVLIDPLVSNTAAHRFYQRLGFQPTGVRLFGTDECLVHRLHRSDYHEFRISRR